MPRRIRNVKSKKSATARAFAKTARANRKKRKERFAVVPASKAVYWPDHIDEVKAIAMTGMTDEEMAVALGVDPDKWESWKQFYPSFAKAIDEGRTRVDANVVAALYKNAVGFTYDADEIVRTRRGAQVLTVEKRFLPETGAQKFWLTNRSAAWRRAQDVNLGGQKGAPAIGVQAETKSMVIHSILNLIRPQPDES